MSGGKEHIIRCAFKLFLEKGYEKTSMMDLVRGSDLSKGAFYHYYKSKEMLFRATIDHFFLEFFDEADKAGTDPDIFEFIGILWKSYSNLLINLASYVNDYTSYYRFLFSAFEMFPDIKEEFYGGLLETFRILEKGFGDLQARGRIAGNLSPKILSEQLISMIEGRGFLLAMDKKENIEQTFRDMIDSFLSSILL